MAAAIEEYVAVAGIPSHEQVFVYDEADGSKSLFEVTRLNFSGKAWRVEVAILDVEQTTVVFEGDEWLELLAEERLTPIVRVKSKYAYQPVKHLPVVATVVVEEVIPSADTWSVRCSVDLHANSGFARHSQEVLALKHHFEEPVSSTEWAKMIGEGYLVLAA